MSTLSPIFGFTIATTSDTVNVVTQIAGNFSSLDSILGAAHTGTGQLKSSVVINTPTLQSPVLSGTLSGGTIVSTTGKFNTVTATGGSVVVNSLGIGTYSYPTTIGNVGQLLTVSGANAVWVDNVPNTGAGVALDNLAAVAINTNLNTFTAGAVTIAKLIATSGSLTNMTTIVSTTGTFSGLNIVGTLNADAINFTGGTVRVASFSVGTYSYPDTVGAAGQFMSVVTGNAVFASNVMTRSPVVFEWHGGCRILNPGSGQGILAVAAGTCPTVAIEGTVPGNFFWHCRSSSSSFAVSTSKPNIITTFYKHHSINTVQFTFRGIVEGTAAAGVATGFAMVSIGTASGIGVLYGTAAAGNSATTSAAFSFVVDVSPLPNGASYPLLVCLGATNSDGGSEALFAINDMIGYIIS
jgi:hypothetical protein